MLSTLIRTPKSQPIAYTDPSRLAVEAGKAIAAGNTLTVACFDNHRYYRVVNPDGNNVVIVTLGRTMAWIAVGANRAVIVDLPVGEFVVNNLMAHLPMKYDSNRKFC